MEVTETECLEMAERWPPTGSYLHFSSTQDSYSSAYTPQNRLDGVGENAEHRTTPRGSNGRSCELVQKIQIPFELGTNSSAPRSFQLSYSGCGISNDWQVLCLSTQTLLLPDRDTPLLQ